MKAVCVFCGANFGHDPIYSQMARQLGQFIAKQGASLIYGGASVGLMGTVAEAVLEKGGSVFGVIPQSLQKKEISHQSLTKLYVVQSMHERKQMMSDLADSFIALPGGFGTFDELCEILTWAQLGLHKKPIGLFNVKNYFDSFLKQLDWGVSEGLLRPEHRNFVLVDSTIEGLWEKMSTYNAPTVEKWISRTQT